MNSESEIKYDLLMDNFAWRGLLMLIKKNELGGYEKTDEINRFKNFKQIIGSEYFHIL